MGMVVVAVAGCASYTGPKHSRFIAAPGASAAPPIAEQAVTVRGLTSVLAVGGQYVGVVVADSTRSDRVSLVHDAAVAAGDAGGTHILLREATIEHRTIPNSQWGTTVHGGMEQTTIQFVDIQRDDIHAVFDVFRVELDRWQMLPPQMRPQPRSPSNR